MQTRTKKLLVICAGAILPGATQAALVNLGAGAFVPLAPQITFSELALGSDNPVFDIPTVSLGNVQVSFAGYFNGQTPNAGFPVTLTDSTPEGPLALGGGTTFITEDGANPTSPVLSGTPQYNGPISILFSTPVSAVGLDGGYFDAIGGTTIEAYGADGSVLGSITNSAFGIEFYGLADSSGANVISGVSFFITGPEPAGFAIDNVTFGSARDLVDPPGGGNNVPDAGSTILLLGASLAPLLGMKRYFRKA